MGPAARALLEKLSGEDLGKRGIPFSTTRDIDVGYARARAARMSYVGGPGYELLVTTDQCVTLYDSLFDAGSAFGLRDAGYYTIDALRVEAGRRAWGAELGPDETPWEAGLDYAVSLQKPHDFIGKAALIAQRGRGVSKRLIMFGFDDASAFAWGGEPVLMDGQSAGEITSAGYSRKHGRVIAMAYVRTASPASDDLLRVSRFAVDVAGEMFAVTPMLKSA
jgi:4-methylaminobutanoate oxidase (formaldehyde-forming)